MKNVKKALLVPAFLILVLIIITQASEGFKEVLGYIIFAVIAIALQSLYGLGFVIQDLSKQRKEEDSDK